SATIVGLNAMVSVSTRSTAWRSASFTAAASRDSGMSSAVVTSTTWAHAGAAASTEPNTSAPATSVRPIFIDAVLTDLPATVNLTRDLRHATVLQRRGHDWPSVSLSHP